MRQNVPKLYRTRAYTVWLIFLVIMWSSKHVRGWLFRASRKHFQTSSTYHRPSRWNAGDVVVTEQNETGRVKAVRGGWVTLQTDDPSAGTLIKVRTTQLRQAFTSNKETDPSDSDSLPQLSQETPKPTILDNPTDVAASTSTPIRLSSLLPPPPPTMINLDAAVAALNDTSDTVLSPRDREYLKQVELFASISKWLVFTDLHVAPSTLETCLAVLDMVNRLAEERNAGILFLGDFWHTRGVLRVDCLNAVLQTLNKFKSPMVLIPGNHDQVTLGGQVHGLTALENAYRTTIRNTSVPGLLVFNHPTLFLNAFLVPHIRSPAVMESVLRSKLAHSASAVLVHADVTGASMNDLMVSTGGVPPSMFPNDKLIYSGHFHKPHTVQGSGRSIEYLGSPYEISLSEAQQPKALAVLDASLGWKLVERIPMHLGRKHFRPATVSEFLKLEPVEENGPGAGVRPGDRVVLVVDRLEQELLRRDDGPNNALDLQVKKLRRHKVLVEVREEGKHPAVSEGVEYDWEDLSAESTWKSFLKEEVKLNRITKQTAEELLPAGLELLEQVEVGPDYLPQRGRESTHLQLLTVTVEGFGPFENEFTYPLDDRGLVLLRGTNLDGGSDSNGSGKTSLAMSALWCLTGSLDARPFEDSKVADVINDNAKAARVSLHGTLNGVKFTVSRIKTASKTGLVFLFGGVDISAQSAKETQLLIDERLRVSSQLLARTMFHGQHAIDGLLDSTDTRFKDELSFLVPMGLWREAVASARQRGRDASKRSDFLRGMQSIRSGDVELLRRRVDLMKEELSEHQKRVHDKESELQVGEDLAAQEGSPQTVATISELDEKLRSTSKIVLDLEVTFRHGRSAKFDKLRELEEQLSCEMDILAVMQQKHESLRRQVETDKSNVQWAEERVKTLETQWAFNLSFGLPDDFSLPSRCPTCSQSLDDDGVGHDHGELRETVLREASWALHNLRKAKEKLRDSEILLDQASSDLENTSTNVLHCRTNIQQAELKMDGEIEKIQNELSKARSLQLDVSAQLASTAKRVELYAQVAAAKFSRSLSEQSELSAITALDLARNELHEREAELNQLALDQEKESIREKTMTSLATAFGQRGVQTFLLRNAVIALEAYSQRYLDAISDGAQRLSLTLDSGDRIVRRAYVRDGDLYRERPLASLSGGQWRRCSLALTFGFAELASRRGRLAPNLLVLDEPLTHLDRSGRTDVGRMLKRLIRHDGSDSEHFSVATILLILQDLAAEEIEEEFDSVDEVIKKGGTTAVYLDCTL